MTSVRIRSVLFNLAFFGGSTLLALLMLPLLPLPANAVRRAGRFWSRATDRALAATVGARLEIRGTPPAGGVIIAAKHQSAWETIAFARLLASPCYVLKRELSWIPLFGWYLIKTRQIIIDRRAGASALRRVIRQAERALAAGRQVVVFPEGTRLPPGTRRPYQPGIAGLYQQTGRAVVPVALTTGLLWPRNGFVKRPGRAVLEFLPPIPPGLDRQTFLARLEQAIETHSERLLHETAAPVSAPDRRTDAA